MDDERSPNAPEICDGNDNDCDGSVDIDDPDVIDATVYYLDADLDGYGDTSDSIQVCVVPNDRVTNADDCNDSDATIYPGAQSFVMDN